MITASERDDLASAYVLGTLAASERSIARTLITVDPSFAAMVERHATRLHPLNELVMPIDPPADLWQRIVARRTPPVRPDLPPAPVVPQQPDVPAPAEEPPAITEAEPLLAPAEAVPFPELSSYLEVAPPPLEYRMANPPEGEAPTNEAEPQHLPLRPSARIARDFDNQLVIAAGRLRRSRDGWRVLALFAGLMALLLAGWVFVRELRPQLIPANLEEALAGLRKFADPPANIIPVPQQPVLVGVLMPANAANPGFVIGLDLVSRTVIVNAIPSDPPTGQAHQLWLVVPSLPGPQSLGVIKTTGVLRPPVLATLDARVIGRAQYAITLEPESGSPTGAPTGPVIFGGTLMAP